MLLPEHHGSLLKQRVYPLDLEPHLLNFSLLLSNSHELLLQLFLQDFLSTRCQSRLLLDVFVEHPDVISLLLVHALATLQQLLELRYLPLKSVVRDPSLAALAVLIKQPLLELLNSLFIALPFHVRLLKQKLRSIQLDYKVVFLTWTLIRERGLQLDDLLVLLLYLDPKSHYKVCMLFLFGFVGNDSVVLSLHFLLCIAEVASHLVDFSAQSLDVLRL